MYLKKFYKILESKEAYAYWNETIDQRNISKRAFDHFTREERITDEIIKLNKKQKVVEEEEEKGAEARASPSIKADIWSDWSDFLYAFIYNNENYEDINNYR